MVNVLVVFGYGLSGLVWDVFSFGIVYIYFCLVVRCFILFL